MNEPVSILQKLLLLMQTTPQWLKRPECSEVLVKYNEWSIDKNILTNDPTFESTHERLLSKNNSFYLKYMLHIIQRKFNSLSISQQILRNFD